MYFITATAFVAEKDFQYLHHSQALKLQHYNPSQRKLFEELETLEEKEKYKLINIKIVFNNQNIFYQILQDKK